MPAGDHLPRDRSLVPAARPCRRRRPARLEVDGRAADLFRGLQIDAATIVSGNSLAGLRPGVGAAAAEPRAFRAEGRLLADDAAYAFKAARAKIGATDLAGELAWSRRGERPSFRATLASDITDLADLQWLAGKGASTAAPAARRRRPVAAAASSGGGVGLRRRARARSMARSPSRQSAFASPRCRCCRSLKLDARLDAGVLAVSGLDLGWGGGHSTGSIGLDLRQHPPCLGGAARDARHPLRDAGSDERRRSGASPACCTAAAR